MWSQVSNRAFVSLSENPMAEKRDSARSGVANGSIWGGIANCPTEKMTRALIHSVLRDGQIRS
jgi:hypothetical protein